MSRIFVRLLSNFNKTMRAPPNPLIAVIGSTGTGKSDLAVELARKFNGEIINGDAMQLYEGLPIITNKITQEEMKGVPHHLLGCIGLQEETWTVGKFVNKALDVIEGIRSRDKLPILVGGTHYYTQSLLFHNVLANEPDLDLETNNTSYPILEEPTSVIHAKLKEVDPIMADRWHPNERRKIQRSLEIYLRTGKPASQIYSEQRQRRELSPSSRKEDQQNSNMGLRFPTLVIWVHASKDALYPRLDGRIGKMLDRGLLAEAAELTSFRRDYENRTGTKVDQSRGIWVSIGYKEFLEYQRELASGSLSDSELDQLKMAAIQKHQAATRQFANRQMKWIRIKLLNALIDAGQKKNAFLFDASDLAKWESDVIQSAIDVAARFLAGKELPQPSSLSSSASEMLTPKRDYDHGQRPDLWQKRTCETCGIVAVTANNWMLHVKSRAHRRAEGLRKKDENRKNAPRTDREALQDVVDVLESYQSTLADIKEQA